MGNEEETYGDDYTDEEKAHVCDSDDPDEPCPECAQAAGEALLDAEKDKILNPKPGIRSLVNSYTYAQIRKFPSVVEDDCGLPIRDVFFECSEGNVFLVFK